MVNLNPGIRKTVQWLQERGFKTCDSGDGVTHDFECDRPWPYVVMNVSPFEMVEEADRLLCLLRQWNIEISELDEEGECVSITTYYDPCTKNAYIDLTNLDDNQLFGCYTV